MTHPRNENPLVYRLKGEARELQQAHSASGTPMRLTDCQHELARKHGYSNWNALIAQVDNAAPFAPSLKDLLRDLRSLEGTSAGHMRHFVCEASPLDCKVALIGTNPGTTTPFWPHVTADYGMARLSFLQNYLQIYGKFGRSRLAIERFVPLIEAGVVELNAFAKQSVRVAELGQSDRSTHSFTRLMNAIRPRVAVCAGADAARAVKQLGPDWEITVLEVRHFIYWGREMELQLATKINEILHRS